MLSRSPSSFQGFRVQSFRFQISVCTYVCVYMCVHACIYLHTRHLCRQKNKDTRDNFVIHHAQIMHDHVYDQQCHKHTKNKHTHSRTRNPSSKHIAVRIGLYTQNKPPVCGINIRTVISLVVCAHHLITAQSENLSSRHLPYQASPKVEIQFSSPCWP